MNTQEPKKLLAMTLRKGAIFEMELSDSQDPETIKTLTQLFQTGEKKETKSKTTKKTDGWELVVYIDGRVSNTIRSPQPPVPGPPGTPPVRVRIIVRG